MRFNGEQPRHLFARQPSDRDIVASRPPEGVMARLLVLSAILPPPPTPDEAAIIAKRLRDSQRRVEMGVQS